MVVLLAHFARAQCVTASMGGDAMLKGEVFIRHPLAERHAMHPNSALSYVDGAAPLRSMGNPRAGYVKWLSAPHSQVPLVLVRFEYFEFTGCHVPNLPGATAHGVP
jgi:hypothetical protein